MILALLEIKLFQKFKEPFVQIIKIKPFIKTFIELTKTF